jgi:large subunit ribosomal protein L23
MSVEIYIKPVISEKASESLQDNKYTFIVGTEINKIQVRNFVEGNFKVEVEKVNILNRKGKKRRRGKIVGMTKGTRRAVVTLKKGEVIEAVKGMY